MEAKALLLQRAAQCRKNGRGETEEREARTPVTHSHTNHGSVSIKAPADLPVRGKESEEEAEETEDHTNKVQGATEKVGKKKRKRKV